MARCRIAWGKFRQLQPILTSRHVTLKTRAHLFTACVRSALLHGSETWATKSDDLSRLKRNDGYMIRWIYGNRPQEEISYSTLLDKLSLLDSRKSCVPADSDGMGMSVVPLHALTVSLL